MRIFLWLVGIGVASAVAVYVAFQVSPRPGVFLIRLVFDRGADAASRALEKHLPKGVTALLNEPYDPANKLALLDVYYPTEVERTEKSLTTVVWVHGGGYVSGRKEDIGNYARILASKGYTVVSIDYTIAPEAKYPTPLRQTNAALGYLAQNAARLHVNAKKLVLAGDSGGAHIAAQVANVISAPAYAQMVGITPAIARGQLAGMILYCGPYGVDGVNFEGAFGGFLRTILWAYFGRKDFFQDPRLDQFSVARHVTAAFPPTFISAGNTDPLLPQSQTLAAKLKEKGVFVDELLFPASYTPPLGHEYQFNLDNEAGRLALERSIKFLSAR
jgi:acetyl esterase/lipase